MEQEGLVGIDVGSKELVVKLMVFNQTNFEKTFVNDNEGYGNLIKWLKKHGKTFRICLEATGIYYLNAALSLHRAGFEIMVVNPRGIKSFSKAMMKRAKTDKVDADTILNYLQRMPFQKWMPPSENILHLQHIARRIRQLKKEMTREKNREHAFHYYDEASFVKNDVESNIRNIDKRIQGLLKNAIEIIKLDSSLQKIFCLLCSAKGIAELSALCIMAEILILPLDMQAEQWVAYAGLDPRAQESGTSINLPRRISKTGNCYLRTAIYIPALVAIKHDPNVKLFYEKLLAKGKKKLQAIVAVMRKLLHCIWGMLKHKQPFDSNKFYVISG